MGIKYFFKWFKESFPETIKKFGGENQRLRDVLNNNEESHQTTTLKNNGVDKPCLLLLDLNGIIHTSCQKIYKYGSFELKFLLKKSPPVNSGDKDLLVFEDVLKSINSLIGIIDPQEVVLCIDGIAPISKQIQQRQRRFLSRKTNGGFDSNCISAGTDFLYRLGIYLKNSIERKMENEWLNVSTVYFMDSLVPGEGEHKLFDFLRSNQTRITNINFNIIVVGNDADLIMLSLLISTLFIKKNLIYILREDLTSKKLNYILVNINQFKTNILKFAMDKPDFKSNHFEFVVCDFVILCFMVGNDFLPSIPLFNIYDGGLDLMMKYYFNNSGYITFKSNSNNPYDQLGVEEPNTINITQESQYTTSNSFITTKDEVKQPKHTNHDNPLKVIIIQKTSEDDLINKHKDIKDHKKIQISFKNLCDYFNYLTEVICPQAVQHYKTREYGFPNILLDVACDKKTSFKDKTNHYLKTYTIHHNINKTLVHAYLMEIDWVFNYYVYGGYMVDWKMYYPSQFAPTSIDLRCYIKKFNNVKKFHSTCNKGPNDFKIDPFFQLLCILPPHSCDLLPYPLNKILTENMVNFHPKDIQIDCEGKLNDWEGIPILPPLDYQKIFELYMANINHCSKEDLKRNKASKQLKITVV